MTATLNGAPCSEVRGTIPRYGYGTLYATFSTTDAPAVSGAPGGASLVVAGLPMRCTVVRQGAPGGTRTVELVTGYGGWRRSVRPQGFRLGNLVSLAAYAEDIAKAAGERVVLAAGVDRKLAAVGARLGLDDAGSLLSQACSMPAGAAVVPWWVDLDGTTRLGPRTGGAVTAQVSDSDELGRRYSYSLDDATTLLPGATVDGSTIEELRIVATGDSVLEVVTLALPGEEPRTFSAVMRRLILSIVGPHVSARTLYRYVVRHVYEDRRLRAVPVRALLAPDLDGLRVWPGLAGGRCRPQVGSEILVQFADGDPVADAACVVGFSPADVGTLGIPEQVELDGDEVVLARGELAVARVTDTTTTGALGFSGSGALSITYTPPGGSLTTLTITATAGGNPVVFAGGGGLSLGGVITSGRNEVLA